MSKVNPFDPHPDAGGSGTTRTTEGSGHANDGGTPSVDPYSAPAESTPSAAPRRPAPKQE